ncbi:MAG: hypothetical protein PHR06_04515 [Candidatus Cloacimonetes bacterium]|nr:hypothetical protein [Candidatus Cloacimonadota bacterium]
MFNDNVDVKEIDNNENLSIPTQISNDSDDYIFDNKSIYRRSISEDEKRIFTKNAYGFLLQLLQNGSITADFYEEIINLCVHVEFFARRKIDRDSLIGLIDKITISKHSNIHLREILEIIEDKLFTNKFHR